MKKSGLQLGYRAIKNDPVLNQLFLNEEPDKRGHDPTRLPNEVKIQKSKRSLNEKGENTTLLDSQGNLSLIQLRTIAAFQYPLVSISSLAFNEMSVFNKESVGSQIIEQIITETNGECVGFFGNSIVSFTTYHHVIIQRRLSGKFGLGELDNLIQTEYDKEKKTKTIPFYSKNPFWFHSAWEKNGIAANKVIEVEDKMEVELLRGGIAIKAYALPVKIDENNIAYGYNGGVGDLYQWVFPFIMMYILWYHKTHPGTKIISENIASELLGVVSGIEEEKTLMLFHHFCNIIRFTIFLINLSDEVLKGIDYSVTFQSVPYKKPEKKPKEKPMRLKKLGKRGAGAPIAKKAKEKKVALKKWKTQPASFVCASFSYYEEEGLKPYKQNIVYTDVFYTCEQGFPGVQISELLLHLSIIDLLAILSRARDTDNTICNLKEPGCLNSCIRLFKALSYGQKLENTIDPSESIFRDPKRHIDSNPDMTGTVLAFTPNYDPNYREGSTNSWIYKITAYIMNQRLGEDTKAEDMNLIKQEWMNIMNMFSIPYQGEIHTYMMKNIVRAKPIIGLGEYPWIASVLLPSGDMRVTFPIWLNCILQLMSPNEIERLNIVTYPRYNDETYKIATDLATGNKQANDTSAKAWATFNGCASSLHLERGLIQTELVDYDPFHRRSLFYDYFQTFVYKQQFTTGIDFDYILRGVLSVVLMNGMVNIIRTMDGNDPIPEEDQYNTLEFVHIMATNIYYGDDPKAKPIVDIIGVDLNERTPYNAMKPTDASLIKVSDYARFNLQTPFNLAEQKEILHIFFREKWNDSYTNSIVLSSPGMEGLITKIRVELIMNLFSDTFIYHLFFLFSKKMKRGWFNKLYKNLFYENRTLFSDKNHIYMTGQIAKQLGIEVNRLEELESTIVYPLFSGSFADREELAKLFNIYIVLHNAYKNEEEDWTDRILPTINHWLYFARTIISAHEFTTVEDEQEGKLSSINRLISYIYSEKLVFRGEVKTVREIYNIMLGKMTSGKEELLPIMFLDDKSTEYNIIFASIQEALEVTLKTYVEDFVPPEVTDTSKKILSIIIVYYKSYMSGILKGLLNQTDNTFKENPTSTQFDPQLKYAFELCLRLCGIYDHVCSLFINKETGLLKEEYAKYGEYMDAKIYVEDTEEEINSILKFNQSYSDVKIFFDNMILGGPRALKETLGNNMESVFETTENAMELFFRYGDRLSKKKTSTKIDNMKRIIEAGAEATPDDYLFILKELKEAIVNNYNRIENIVFGLLRILSLNNEIIAMKIPVDLWTRSKEYVAQKCSQNSEHYDSFIDIINTILTGHYRIETRFMNDEEISRQIRTLFLSHKFIYNYPEIVSKGQVIKLLEFDSAVNDVTTNQYHNLVFPLALFSKQSFSSYARNSVTNIGNGISQALIDRYTDWIPKQKWNLITGSERERKYQITTATPKNPKSLRGLFRYVFQGFIQLNEYEPIFKRATRDLLFGGLAPYLNKHYLVAVDTSAEVVNSYVGPPLVALKSICTIKVTGIAFSIEEKKLVMAKTEFSTRTSEAEKEIKRSKITETGGITVAATTRTPSIPSGPPIPIVRPSYRYVIEPTIVPESTEYTPKPASGSEEILTEMEQSTSRMGPLYAPSIPSGPIYTAPLTLELAPVRIEEEPYFGVPKTYEGIYPFGYMRSLNRIDRYAMNHRDNLIALGKSIMGDVAESYLLTFGQVVANMMNALNKSNIHAFANICDVIRDVQILDMNPLSGEFVGTNDMVCYHLFSKPGEELIVLYFIVGCWVSIRIMNEKILNTGEYVDETTMAGILDTIRSSVTSTTLQSMILAEFDLDNDIALLRMPFILFSQTEDQVVIPVMMFVLTYDWIEKNIYIHTNFETPFSLIGEEYVLDALVEGHRANRWSITYDGGNFSVYELFFLSILATHQRHMFRFVVMNQNIDGLKLFPSLNLIGIKSAISGSIRRTSTRTLRSLNIEVNAFTSGSESVYFIPVESAVYTKKYASLFRFHIEIESARFWQQEIEKLETEPEKQKLLIGIWDIIWNLGDFIYKNWDHGDFKTFVISEDGSSVDELLFHTTNLNQVPVLWKATMGGQVPITTGAMILAAILFPLIRRYPIFLGIRGIKALLNSYTSIKMEHKSDIGYEPDRLTIPYLMYIDNIYPFDVEKNIVDKVSDLDSWKFIPTFESETVANKVHSIKMDRFFAETNVNISSGEIPFYASLIDDLTSTIFENPSLFPILLSMVPYGESSPPLNLPFIGIDYLSILNQMIFSSFIEVSDTADYRTKLLLKRAFFNMFGVYANDLVKKMVEMGFNEEKQYLILLYSILHGPVSNVELLIESYESL